MSSYPEYYDSLRDRVDARLTEVIDRDKPDTIYSPSRFVLTGGGKRIRPVLAMLACEAAGGTSEDAVNAAVAIEILHNFTLVHDDIMDNADQRRGRPTVHKKWDENIAILVGDNLIGIAYRTLLHTGNGDIRKLVAAFTDGMIEVCEGQAYDKEFEALPSVSLDDYFMMIRKKTGRLVTMSAELGAIIAGASGELYSALMEYASYIGRAFQVQDDLLDVIANEKNFGKPIGGDILEGKKSFLLVKAMELAKGVELDLLHKVARRNVTQGNIVSEVTNIYERLGVLESARLQIRNDTDAALSALHQIPDSNARQTLLWFAEMLLARTK
jgi:geranylgeranyl diphosphate synthase, type II